MSFAASYYKMLSHLTDKFDIYALDLPGMGLSSRPNFDYKNHSDSLEFFLNSLDKFMIE